MKYRFERQFEKEFDHDDEAFEYACGWHDERDAIVEKWLHGKWCPAADPARHPQFFYGKADGGWIIAPNKVIPYQN